MQEIKIKIGEVEYTLNNNSYKYDRAKHDAGENATGEQVLAHYDKLAGFIKNENGNKIENGRFWKIEKERLAKIQKQKEKLKGIMKWAVVIGKYFIGILTALIAAYFIYKLGWNR